MTVEIARPRRDIAWFRAQSTPIALVIAATGAVALGLVTLGSLAAIVVQGATPVASLVAAMRSALVRNILGTGIVAGGLALVAGGIAYRRMPTKLAREEAVVGLALGAQAAAAGSLGLWFLGGDVETFARNFLDLERLSSQGSVYLAGARNTLMLAVGGEAIGIALGLLLAVFAISKRAVVRAPARIYINFFRGTPLLWQLSFLYLAIRLGLRLDLSVYTIGIIVFGLNTAAYAAEVFRAGIQSIERGQLEAARGLGMSYVASMRYAVVPQAVRRVIPPLANEFVILVKDTSLIILLGLTRAERELMAVGQSGYENSFNATFLVGTALGYLSVSLPLIGLVTLLERKLRSGLVGVTGA